MTFQQKLLAGTLIMILPTVAIGVQAIRGALETSRVLARLERDSGTVLLLHRIEARIFRQAKEIPDYLTGREPTARSQFLALDREVTDQLARAGREVDDPDRRRRLEDLEAVYRRFREVAARAYALQDAGHHARAYALVEDVIEGEVFPALSAALRGLTHEYYRSSFEDALAHAHATERSTWLLLGATLAASVGAGILYAVVLSHRLSRALHGLIRMMKSAGGGDRRDPALSARADEIGEVARTFTGMMQELDAMQRKLVHSETMATVGAMSAAVAHGLRNPLASVRALAQMCLHELDAPAALRDDLERIIDEVDRLERRIRHLLAFSRPSTPHPVPDDLNHAVQRVLPAFADRFREQGVSVELALAPDLPAALVDPAEIEHVLIEVIANAADAMPRGGRLLVRTSGPDEHEGTGLGVEIADSGEGIEETVLPHIFKPFFSTRADGTGLGLPMARRLIEQNGGAIVVGSHPHGGTTVRLVVPVAAGVRQESQACR
jgi:signal transduction histidine kinase